MSEHLITDLAVLSLRTQVRQCPTVSFSTVNNNLQTLGSESDGFLSTNKGYKYILLTYVPHLSPQNWSFVQCGIYRVVNNTLAKKDGYIPILLMVLPH